MKTNAEKPNISENRNVASGKVSQKVQNGPVSRNAQNPLEASITQEIQALADNSPAVKQQNAYQQMADNSPRVKQLKAVKMMADKSKSTATQPPQNSTIQRMVSMTNWNRVYAPDTLAIDDRFGTTLNALMGADQQITRTNWAGLKEVIWPDGAQDEAPLEAIHNKFQHPRKVHVYANAAAAMYDGESGVKNLLLPADMSENGDALPAALAPASACVIQALVDFGIAAPAGAATDQSWHAWSRAQNLDYRTDSDIVRIYVRQLGYRLVNNKTVNMQDVDWAALGGDGNYLAASYLGLPGGVGHMIGLVINAGAIQAIHDRQNLTAPTINENPAGVTARYIYKM